MNNVEFVKNLYQIVVGVDVPKVCYKFLKPSGHIRCGVPDAFFQDETYQNLVKVGGTGPKDHPAAKDKILYY